MGELDAFCVGRAHSQLELEPLPVVEQRRHLVVVGGAKLVESGVDPRAKLTPTRLVEDRQAAHELDELYAIAAWRDLELKTANGVRG